MNHIIISSGYMAAYRAAYNGQLVGTLWKFTLNVHSSFLWAHFLHRKKKTSKELRCFLFSFQVNPNIFNYLDSEFDILIIFNFLNITILHHITYYILNFRSDLGRPSFPVHLCYSPPPTANIKSLYSLYLRSGKLRFPTNEKLERIFMV